MTTTELITAILSILVAAIYIAYLLRHAVRGDPDRAAEDAAREYFDEHGHWPDEEPR